MTGQQFGHYEVESRLGSGGMGVVYLARDIRLKRRVAIKVLADGRVADELARARFRREAQALSRLNHPNIATIYDFDQQDGRDFLVMEYIEGQSLRDVGPDPLPPADVVRLGTQLAEALVAAHGAGVVHLDLKPGNMMLTADGRLKVLDFGIARLHAPDPATARRTRGAFDTITLPSAAGTPPYMAPEQVAAGPVDSRTDIYAAGATLYELATGHRVFDKPRGAGLNEAILRDKPDPPSQLNPGIPATLEDALMKALEKQPVNRQQTAQELLQDFQKAADTSAAIAVRPHRGWRRREIALTAVAVLVAVALTGYALWPASVRATFHARDFVLVGDLENATPDPLLSRTVQQALSISLQQSKFVNLVSRDRVADALAPDEAAGHRAHRRADRTRPLPARVGAGAHFRLGDAQRQPHADCGPRHRGGQRQPALHRHRGIPETGGALRQARRSRPQSAQAPRGIAGRDRLVLAAAAEGDHRIARGAAAVLEVVRGQGDGRLRRRRVAAARRAAARSRVRDGPCQAGGLLRDRDRQRGEGPARDRRGLPAPGSRDRSRAILHRRAVLPVTRRVRGESRQPESR